MKNPILLIALTLSAVICEQAPAQSNAARKNAVDPETVQQAEKLLQQIQGEMKGGASKEQAVNQAVNQMVKGIQSRQKDQLNSMAANLKTIKVGVHTKDDVASKLGKPLNSMKYGDFENWNYVGGVSGGGSLAAVLVQFNATGLVTAVQATKMSLSGTAEMVYSSGQMMTPGMGAGPVPLSNGPTLVNRSAQAPDKPEEGQIYFNTSEKCFYGWNGTLWTKLGTP